MKIEPLLTLIFLIFPSISFESKSIFIFLSNLKKSLLLSLNFTSPIVILKAFALYNSLIP